MPPVTPIKFIKRLTKELSCLKEPLLNLEKIPMPKRRTENNKNKDRENFLAVLFFIVHHAAYPLRTLPVFASETFLFGEIPSMSRRRHSSWPNSNARLILPPHWQLLL